MINIAHIVSDSKFDKMIEGAFAIKNVNNIYIQSGVLNNVDIRSYNLLIVHQMNVSALDFLFKHHLDIPIIWFFWGSDGFTLGKFYNKFLMPKTKKIRNRLIFSNGYKNWLIHHIFQLIPKLKDLRKHNRRLLKIIKRIKIVVPIVPGDYKLLANSYTINSQFFHVNYVNQIFSENVDSTLKGDNILLGNSSSLTNNHIDAIDLIKNIGLKNRKLIIPLSYGDKEYAKIVSTYSDNIFGQQSQCLIDFLPYDEYQEILSTCSIMIMFHLRQQALGNIIQGLMTGLHIYMQSQSTLFQYLREHRFIISNIEYAKEFCNLNEDQKNYNRMLCIKVFGKETQLNKMEILLNSALL